MTNFGIWDWSDMEKGTCNQMVPKSSFLVISGGERIFSEENCSLGSIYEI